MSNKLFDTIGFILLLSLVAVLNPVRRASRRWSWKKIGVATLAISGITLLILGGIYTS